MVGVVKATEVDPATCAVLAQLEYGPVRPFADWPDNEVPPVAAAVYTIWSSTQLIYVGMSGRGRSADVLAHEATRKARRAH